MTAVTQRELAPDKGAAAPLWAAIGLFGLVITISVTYGFQYLFPGERLAQYYRIASAPFFLILVGMTWQAARGGFAQNAPISWPQVLGFLLMSVSFVLTGFFLSSKLAPIPWPLLAFGVIGAAGYCQFKWGSRGSSMVFLSCALAIYAFMIARVPHVEGANMLEIVEDASREFLSGRPPYVCFDMSSGHNCFGYLPGLWLPYLPLIKLDLDVRIFNLIALISIIWLFERSLRHHPSRADALSLTLYPFVLSSPLALMVLYGHVWPYWLFLSITMFMLMRGRLASAAVLFGVSLATRQPAVFLIGPLAAYVFREKGLKATLTYGLIAAALYLCLVLPFAMWTGKEFWLYTYLAPGQASTIEPHLSALNFLDLLEGGRTTLRYCQILIIVACIVAILKRKKLDATWFVFVAGLSYAWLIFFNSYAVRYVYFPGLLLMAFALSVRLADGLARRR